jgi:hypothetical protein
MRDVNPLEVGPKVYEIGNRQWDVPPLRTSLETTISGRKTLDALKSSIFSRQSADA